MIREQGPSQHLGAGRLHLGRETLEEVLSVLVGPKEPCVLDPPDHHVVENAGGIQPGAAWHEGRVARGGGGVKTISLKHLLRPLYVPFTQLSELASTCVRITVVSLQWVPN